MRASVTSFMVCGLMLMRVTGWLRSMVSFSRSSVSGLPASTVSSESVPNRSVRRSSRRSSCAVVRLLGVPPPM